MTVYLDANATEPPRPAALDALTEVARLTGNPSSVHAFGREARRVLETARRSLAEPFGTHAEQVIFTSGGTEADALAVHGFGHGRRLLVGATEHDAVLQARPERDILPVHADGTLDLAALERALAGDSPAMVCAMAANNETGVLHPLQDIAALCRKAGAWLHVDAVQAPGRLALDFAASGADSMAISGHKFGGVKGAGALLLRGPSRVEPLMVGGGQERGRRGGTPALPAIAAMTAALTEALGDDVRRIAVLRDRLENDARAAGAMVVGDRASRLGNTTCLVLAGVSAQTQLMTLDLDGIAVSAGSACSSGKVSASHVLRAMGYGPEAGQAIRVSLPWNVVEGHVEAFLSAYQRMTARLGRRDP